MPARSTKTGTLRQFESGVRPQLTREQAQHVEYGYAIEPTVRLALNQVILTGEAEQITAQRKALSQLPTKLHDLTVYTSDGNPHLTCHAERFAAPAVAEISMPAINIPSIEFEEFAIEM